MLPAVLRPGGMKKWSKEERAAFRQSAGVESMADFGRLLEGLPRELVDLLRVSAIVRNQAATLGATPADRMRINAVHAQRVSEHLLVDCLGFWGCRMQWFLHVCMNFKSRGSGHLDICCSFLAPVSERLLTNDLVASYLSTWSRE